MEDILDVQMPPEPEPEPEPERVVAFDEEEEVAPSREQEEQEPEQPVQRTKVPDEEVFKEVPQIKKVKRKPSAKQLAHLEKMRAKKEANRIAKEEWMEEQKSKQKKFVDAEEREVSIRARANPPQTTNKIKNKKIIKNSQDALPTLDRSAPINHPHYDYDTNDPQYAQQEYYYEEPTAPPPLRQEQQVGMYQLSAEQIRELQFNAISDYDTIRKQQKAEKQQHQAKQYLEQKKKQVFKQMRGSAQPQYDANDPWAHCFQ